MRTILALLLFCKLANAQLIQTFSGGNDLSVGPGTAGFSFDVMTPTTINALGIWDSTSGSGLFNPHSIGIWDATTHTLLASAIVPAGISSVVGGFDYVSIPQLTLAAGRSFVLGASYIDNDFDFAKGNISSVTTLPGIVLHDALLSTASTFTFPDLNVSGANLGFFGPNAMFQAVPEPGAWGLVAGVLLLVFSLLRTHGGVIEDTLSKVKRPELAAEAARMVNANPASRSTVLRWIASHRPASLVVVTRTLNDSNRPPVTPGNDHGKRPTVPPGRYATP